MSQEKPNNHNELILEARPSQRVGNQRIEADGDTWQETLAVCEAPTSKNKNTSGKLIIRSYFQNTRSGKRVWDEPPSGASLILPATEEMRRMAELQLAELHIVTGETETETQSQTKTATPTQTQVSEPKKRRGLFGFGKKKEKNITPTVQPKIRYKPGSSLLTSPPQKNREDADAQLQEAIARSLAESQGIPYHATSQPVDDDELAIAKALSLSVVQEHRETEDEVLARVLEESRIEDAMKRGAYQAALSQPEDFQPVHEYTQDWNLDDRKPAALPTPLKQAPPPLPQAVSVSPSNFAYVAASTPTSASGAKSPPRSPVSPLFDPYAKDAPPPTAKPVPQKPVSSLQKMDPNATSPSRLNWGKRTNQKIKDEAGLV